MPFLLITLRLPEIFAEWNYVHSGAFWLILEIFTLFLPFTNYPDVRRLVAASLLTIFMFEQIPLAPLTWELRHSLHSTFYADFEFLLITECFRFCSDMKIYHSFWLISSFPCSPCNSRFSISFKVVNKTRPSPFQSFSFVLLYFLIMFA